MKTSKENIKNWLKNNKLNRKWLAVKCCVSEATVNTWLSSDRPIPHKKLDMIEGFIRGEGEGVASLPDDFESRIRKRAEELKQSIDNFVIDVLADANINRPANKE